MDLDLVSWYRSWKKLFLFRFATLEKWETHFCQRWHLIVLHICVVTILSKCQNVTWLKDLFFSSILSPLNISGQNSRTFSCVANFWWNREMEQKKIRWGFLNFQFTSVPRNLGFLVNLIWSTVSTMICFNPLWSRVIHCDLQSSNMIRSDPVWSISIHYDPKWSGSVHCDLTYWAGSSAHRTGPRISSI